ncbi:MAG: exonuclease domain-containing protein [Velocimicrobium sp.]
MEPNIKTHEILSFPNNYTILDLETTGLHVEEDFIIEVAALKIRKSEIAGQFQTLIQCPLSITKRIETLTGISNKMLVGAPQFSSIASELTSFIGDDIIIGHSILFDITFLTKELEAMMPLSLENSYVDTLPISQKLLPELVHHRLKDMAAYYKFDTQHAHRAMADCKMNYQVFEAMKTTILHSFGSYNNFCSKWNTLSKRIKAETIVPLKHSFDRAHPFYQKKFVITGALSYLSRKEAMQEIANLGGLNMDKLNTTTDFLILGNNEYCDLLTKMSIKQKKALRLIDEGYSIKILSELDFYELLPFEKHMLTPTQG